MKTIEKAIINRLLYTESGKVDSFSYSLCSVRDITKIAIDNIKELQERVDKTKNRDTAWFCNGGITALKEIFNLIDGDLKEA